MQWRLLIRRCPSRSMTVVGDLAQAGSPAAPLTWADVFDRVAPGRWSVQPLTVNYRTPAPMMELAARVLKASGSPVTAPSSVRDGSAPSVIHVPSATHPSEAGAGHPITPATALSAAAAERIAGWAEMEGRTAVITPRSLHESVSHGLAGNLPSGTLGAGSAALEAPVSVLTVAEAKGLEFDQVVLIEPGAILAESARGGHDLYVALTRATQELLVLHSGDLPAGFAVVVPDADPGT